MRNPGAQAVDTSVLWSKDIAMLDGSAGGAVCPPMGIDGAEVGLLPSDAVGLGQTLRHVTSVRYAVGSTASMMAACRYRLS